MAYVAQGTSASWNGVPLGEVVSVSLDGITADTVEVTPRTQLTSNKVYRVADTDLGTVTLTLRGTAAMSSTNVGVMATLAIASPAAYWLFPNAIFERLGWSATVGELQVYSVTLKLSN